MKSLVASPSLARLRGFTLTEMIVVMAIAITLISLSAPLVRGLLTARNVNSAADAFTGYLEYTRTQAISQKTYIAAGFYQPSKSDDLQFNAVRSPTGTFDPTVTLDAQKFRPFTSNIHLSNVRLVPYDPSSSSPQAQLSGPVKDKLKSAGVVPNGSTIVDCCSDGGLSQLYFTSSNLKFDQCVIVFTPQGEALYFPSTTTIPVTPFGANTPYYSQLLIGIRASRNGSIIASDPNSAAISLDGGAGNVNTYRP